MKYRRFLPGIVLALLIPMHILALSRIGEEQKKLPVSDESSSVITGPVVRLTALGNEGVASDFLFLKAIVFYGSTFERNGRPRIKPGEWKWLYNILTASTDADPYFLDPYYFAAGVLTWDSHLIREANELLEKGTRYRDWDWKMPFFLGFNYFYFLQDNGKASEYMMESSRREGSGRVISTLASRLAYEGNRTENAIYFLREILKNTDDPSIKKEYTFRINALETILSLEQAVEKYKKKYGRTPGNLNKLVERKIIPALPKDPYGGEFYLDQKGNVKTTSDLASMRNRR